MQTTILEQSSKAFDRSLGSWFVQISTGAIKLPRFQRFEAWDRWRVTGFLDTIIHNLPVGVTLVLQVGGDEKFVSRYISTAEPKIGAAVTEHLLDGQQRLTAFWRAMHNSYEDESYFVYIPYLDRKDDDGLNGDELRVHCQPRWKKKDGQRYPVWADRPTSVLKRGLIPLDLLRPGDLSVQVDQWIAAATAPLEPQESDENAFKKLKEYQALKEKIKAEITQLRERVTHFNLPYLALPAATAKDVALRVFINMNTNSKPLSLYDLTVAEVEEVVGQSLHDLNDDMARRYPSVLNYGNAAYLALTTAALLQDKPPTTVGIGEMDKSRLVADWTRLEIAISRAVQLLASQGIYDEQRLPTNAVLAVLAACYDVVPFHGDQLGVAERLLRSYMWTSFFADRYENAAATRAFADFKALKAVLMRPKFTPEEFTVVPVLNREAYPLVSVEQMCRVGWPKAMDRYARAIQAVSTYFGALDFADNKCASFESLRSREYHHIFPDALLADAGIDSYLALNCALLTWKTNRAIGRKDPLVYLQERVAWADEATVKARLATHLLDYGRLAEATYDGLVGEELAAKLKPEFEAFLAARAQLVSMAAARLANGEEPSLQEIYSARDGSQTVPV